MKKHQMLHLNTLASSVAQSFQAGIISFDHNLDIIDSNPLAAELVSLRPTINATLSAGTDPNIWGNWKERLTATMEANQQAFFESVKYSNGPIPRLLGILCLPIKDPEINSVIGGAAIITDATKKLATEHEMAQAERLMAIGKVAGNVAHELNNPLDGILRYVNLSLRILEQNQPEKAKEYLLHCRTGLQRMAQIITEMLEFSRSTNLAFETNPIDKTIDDALRAMETSLRNIEVRIVRDYTAPLPHLKSDSIFQVFCNLIKNASDAMQGSGTLTITICKTEHHCRIEFLDSGPGLNTADIDELFKPFYTTKPKGQGTGLGLAICSDILEKLNGTITAQNHPQGGALFVVQLPCSRPANPNRSTL